MTIHERMIPRTEREKDLLKYGRSQERERIIKLLEGKEPNNITSEQDNFWSGYEMAIALIKGEM